MLCDVAKQQKSSNYNELDRVDVRTIKNVELRRKTFKTTQNYKTDQIIMYCDQKCWVTSQNNKSHQNIQNNAKLQNWSNYNVLHRFDVKTIKNVELRRKTFKTTQNNESDHIIIIASIWRQNDQNFWVRWQNYKSNQITMDCIDLTVKRSKQRKTTNKRDQITINLHRFDVKASKRSKMLCFVAKQSKNPKTTNMIKL